MARHDIFFLFALSFLSGIVFASLGLTLLFSLVPAVIIFSVLYITNTSARIGVLAAIVLVVGSMYYAQDEYQYQAALAHVPQSGNIQGIIVQDPKHEIDFQSFYLKTEFGTMAVQTKPEPAFSYGDTLVVSGKILHQRGRRKNPVRRMVMGTSTKPSVR